MNILFCTDGSQISFDAIEKYTQYSKNLVVDIMCVIDWRFYPIYIQASSQNYQSTYEEIADRILDEAQEHIIKTGNLVEKKIKVFGNVAEEILKQTKKQTYDLIVLGSHGKRGIQAWLGSVSREVINTVRSNIFISKNTSDKKDILFTSDGSEYSFYVIQKSLELIDATNCSIYTIYVQKDLNNIPVELKMDKNWLNKIIKEQQEESEKNNKRIRKLFKKKNLLITREITAIGEPAKKILELQNEMNFDLIVMGSHSKNAFQRLILGSTSMRVLERAKNSVLIVFPKEQN